MQHDSYAARLPCLGYTLIVTANELKAIENPNPTLKVNEVR